jgi:hypothetical protein
LHNFLAGLRNILLKAWNWQKEDLPISGPAIDNSFHLRVLGEYADEGSKLERRNSDRIETVTKNNNNAEKLPLSASPSLAKA